MWKTFPYGPGGKKKKKKKRIACIDLIILKQLRRISCFEALGNHQRGLGGNTLLNRLLAKGVFSFLCVTFPEAVQTGHSWIRGEGKIKIIFPKSYSLPRMPEWWWCLDPNSSPKLTSDKNLPAGPSRSRKTSVLACSVRALIREKRFWSHNQIPFMEKAGSSSDSCSPSCLFPRAPTIWRISVSCTFQQWSLQI